MGGMKFVADGKGRLFTYEGFPLTPPDWLKVKSRFEMIYYNDNRTSLLVAFQSNLKWEWIGNNSTVDQYGQFSIP
jgi:hypothetical protein